MLNKIFLETDGLVVGGTQLTTTGGNVNIANNIYVGGNTVTANLVVTGSFTYPNANSSLPAFSVFGNALQNVPGGFVNTPIQYNTIEFDTNNCYNPTSQWLYKNGIYTPPYSWAPNVPGYYMINAAFTAAANATAGASAFCLLYKQNAIYRSIGFNFGSGGAAFTPMVSTVMYMDGKTDYITIMAAHSLGSPLSMGSAQNSLSFNGCFLRPA